MNILYISKNLNRFDHGAAIRSNLLWNALKKIGTVYVLYPTDIDLEDDLENKIFYIKKKKTSGLYRKLYEIQNFFLKQFRLLDFGFFYEKFDQSISEKFKGIHFDVVVSRYIHCPAEYHIFNMHPLIVDIDDHPLQVFDTIKFNTMHWIKRPFAWVLSRLQFYCLMPKFDGGWIANGQQLLGIPTKMPIAVLRNIANHPSAEYNVNSEREQYLLCVGFMGYAPNINGVNKFVNEVWPYVRRHYSSLTLKIVGKGADEQSVQNWENIEGVEYLGFVENLEYMYEKCLASVVPIYEGGGTCLKTIESLSFSRICLSSPFGARGFDEMLGNGLMIFETPDQFVELLCKEVMNKQNRLILETKSDLLVKKNYSSKSFEDSVSDYLVKILKEFN